MEKGDLTYRIIGCAMTVHKKLKRGCREYVYCRALAIELRKAGIAFEREVWLPIHYENLRIAYRRCDFYCPQGGMIEVKARSDLDKGDMTQAINTLEQLNVRDGLLIHVSIDRDGTQSFKLNPYPPQKNHSSNASRSPFFKVFTTCA